MPRLSRQILARAARQASRVRGTFAGGRPRVLKPCPYCAQTFGARELRAHAPHCPGPAISGR